MTDLTLEDLSGSGDDGDDSDGESGSNSEWVGSLIERLDERGYLDALIAQQLDVDMTDTPAITDDGDENSEQTTSGELDHETVAHFGKLVLEEVGDIPISQVVKFAEANPDQVDNLIQQVQE